MSNPDVGGPIESAEELRETLFALRREYDALVGAADQSQHLLDALQSLLTIDPSEDPFPQVFDALRRAVTFSQALMLAEIDANAGELECIVAEIAPAIGTRWPIGAQFQKVLAGRVVATIPSVDAIEWRGAAGLGFSANESALFLPVRVRERRGILVLSFMASILAQLAGSGLANRFVLELTEDALETTQRFQRQVLPQLREHGVRVSIDDFGTGFSSLSTLTDITADEVKVDRTFITAIHEHPRSQGILKAIESLCAALDINVVAEGVETEEELAYIRQHTSIDIVQGYYFAPPMLVSELPVDFLWQIGSDIG